MTRKKKIFAALAVIMTVTMVFGITASAATENANKLQYCTIAGLDAKDLKPAAGQKEISISATLSDDGTVVLKDQDGNIVTGFEAGEDTGVLQSAEAFQVSSNVSGFTTTISEDGTVITKDQDGNIVENPEEGGELVVVQGEGIIEAFSNDAGYTTSISEDGTVVTKDQNGNIVTGEEANQVLGAIQGEGSMTVSAEGGVSIVTGNKDN